MFPKENLLAFWKLDNLTDSRGNRYTLTNNGGVQFVAGKIGNCAEFNGTNELTNSSFTPVFNAAQDFSISFWANPTSNVLGTTVGGGGNGVFNIHNDSSGTLNFNNAQAGDVNVPNAFTVGTWKHYVCIKAGGRSKVYINGSEVYNQNSNVSYTNTTTTISIGRYPGGTLPYQGYIDAVGIWQRALTLQEIQTLYNNGNGLEPEGILFLEDSSTNSLQLTLNGDAKLDTGIKKYGGGSAYFDGDGDYLQIAGSSTFDFYNTNYTVEMWVFSAASQSGGALITTRLAGIYSPWELQITSSNKIGLLIQNGSSSWYQPFGGAPIVGNATIPQNQWTHIAWVCNGANTTVYVNGVADSALTNLNIPILQTHSLPSNIYIGKGGDGAFNGYIDELRITKGIARYTSNFTPPQQQLPAPSDTYGDNVSLLLHMDGLSGSQTFTDSSTNNFTLTAYGDVQIDTSIKKFGNGAALFDGNGDYLLAQSNNALVMGSGDFTVELWLYPISLTQDQQIVSCSSNNGFGIGMQSNTLFGVTNTFVSWELAGTAPSLNQWSHVAVTRQSGYMRIFINGIITAQNTVTTNYTSPTNSIAGLAGYSWSNTNCYIDELRITKGVARYTANFVPQTAPFVNPVLAEWDYILNSTYGSNIVAAYDFRDYNGSNSVTSKIGPNLETSNVTQVAEGLEFVKGNTSWAFANSTVACSYPFTMVFVAKTTNTSTNESVLINCSPTRFGQDILVFTRGSSSQGLMPYNGADNQVTNYLPDGTEWYFYAVSFLNDGTVRYATRKASGNLNGTVNGNNGSTFNGYPGVAAGFGSQSQYGTSGKFRLALFINQAFSTEGQMDYLFNTILSGPASDLALQ
jgi:hypothetical protein